jgi:D-aminopeptidase
MKIDRRALLQLIPATLSPAAELGSVVGRKRPRDLGIRFGRMAPGRWNAITDVPGVLVGHSTIIRGSGPLKVGEGPVRTGVTAVWPHPGIFREYLPAGFHMINGNGEVTGLEQITHLGMLGSPLLLTNTSSVGMVFDAVLSHPEADPRIVPVVGETWDAFLNDIEGRHVHADHVYEALKNASTGPVAEGSVGGGTGMICYQFKGGIGTASRRLPSPLQAFSVGVLVQANHGARQDLRIDGVPVGEEITNLLPEPDEAGYLNSILIVIATDAPLLDYQLNRLARRAAMGLAKTGSISRNSSGDFAIAFSTANKVSGDPFWGVSQIYAWRSVEQFHIDSLFEAVSEATEEAIINSMFLARDMTGRDGHVVHAIPIDRVLRIMDRNHRLFRHKERKIAALRIGFGS